MNSNVTAGPAGTVRPEAANGRGVAVDFRPTAWEHRIAIVPVKNPEARASLEETGLRNSVQHGWEFVSERGGIYQYKRAKRRGPLMRRVTGEPPAWHLCG